jgi:hypothetical protein
MWLPRRKKLTRPVDVALRIGWVGPTGQDNQVVLQVAVIIRCLGLADSAVRTV